MRQRKIATYARNFLEHYGDANWQFLQFLIRGDPEAVFAGVALRDPGQKDKVSLPCPIERGLDRRQGGSFDDGRCRPYAFFSWPAFGAASRETGAIGVKLERVGF